jgi:hypothetical protein
VKCSVVVWGNLSHYSTNELLCCVVKCCGVRWCEVRGRAVKCGEVSCRVGTSFIILQTNYCVVLWRDVRWRAVM